MVEDTVLFRKATSVLIAAIAINCALFVCLVVVVSYLGWYSFRVKRQAFASAALVMIRIQQRMKLSRLSLDEFLCVCQILEISRARITEVYQDMHRNRRKIGESWLFDEDTRSQKSSKKGSTKTRRVNRYRQIPIFRSFAASSQFTQGFDGYHLHRLLHTYRTAEYTSSDVPEAATLFQVTQMCSTIRQLEKKAASAKEAGKSISIRPGTAKKGQKK